MTEASKVAVNLGNFSGVTGPATTIAQLVRPVRPGARPYTEKTRGARRATLRVTRTRDATAANTPIIRIYGASIPTTADGPSNRSVSDTDPTLIASLNPATATSPLQYATANGAIKQVMKAATGATSANVGNLIVINAGYGYTPNSTISFTVAGGGSATGITDALGRIVGAYYTGTVTTAGLVVVPAPTNITIANGGKQAAVAVVSNDITAAFATAIPYTAGDASWIQGGYALIALWREHLIPIVDNQAGTYLPSAIYGGYNAANGVLTPDQHIIGLSTALVPGAGTVTASGGLAQITLPFGVPSGDRVTFIKAPALLLADLGSGASALTNYEEDIRVRDLMWSVVTGVTAAATTDFSAGLISHVA